MKKKPISIDISSSYYPLLVCLFCTFALLGNILALKTSTIFGLTTPSGMICFPFTFSVCDIITEVYGDEAATKTIRLGLLILLIYYTSVLVVTMLPPSPEWTKQNEWSNIFCISHLIFVATLPAFYFGEKVNSKLLSMLKYVCNKKYFLKRSLVSTFLGVIVDTLLFNFIAFYWITPFEIWINMIKGQLILKLFFEAFGSTIASYIQPYLKQHEGMDPVTEWKWIDKYIGKNNLSDNKDSSKEYKV